jgi:hypothetical protein
MRDLYNSEMFGAFPYTELDLVASLPKYNKRLIQRKTAITDDKMTCY